MSTIREVTERGLGQPGRIGPTGSAGLGCRTGRLSVRVVAPGVFARG